MKVVGQGRIADFCRLHPAAKDHVDALIAEFREAAWTTPHELKNRYPTASLIGDKRVVFNIRGNRYRLDVKINYLSQTILIMRAGTHKDYDSWAF